MMMLQGEKNPSKKVVKNKFHALVAERKQSAKEELDAKKRPREPAAVENTEERRAAFVVQKYEKTRDAVVQDVAGHGGRERGEREEREGGRAEREEGRKRGREGRKGEDCAFSHAIQLAKGQVCSCASHGARVEKKKKAN